MFRNRNVNPLRQRNESTGRATARDRTATQTSIRHRRWRPRLVLTGGVLQSPTIFPGLFDSLSILARYSARRFGDRDDPSSRRGNLGIYHPAPARSRYSDVSGDGSAFLSFVLRIAGLVRLDAA